MVYVRNAKRNKYLLTFIKPLAILYIMKQIKPPISVLAQFKPTDKPIFLFLCGSIEMGVAEEWQERVARELKNSKWIILNPRRDDWDSSWVQSIDNEKFVEQVVWELEGLERASAVLIYFDPTTKSPITLLELGLVSTFLGTERLKDIVVVCPEGFWRKGNVDIVCQRYGHKQFNSLTDAIRYFRER